MGGWRHCRWSESLLRSTLSSKDQGTGRAIWCFLGPPRSDQRKRQVRPALVKIDKIQPSTMGGAGILHPRCFLLPNVSCPLAPTGGERTVAILTSLRDSWRPSSSNHLKYTKLSRHSSVSFSCNQSIRFPFSSSTSNMVCKTSFYFASLNSPKTILKADSFSSWSDR